MQPDASLKQSGAAGSRREQRGAGAAGSQEHAGEAASGSSPEQRGSKQKKHHELEQPEASREPEVTREA